MYRDPAGSGRGSHAPASVNLSGRCVGASYLLVCPIGRGATGTVWRGIDRGTGEEVAVKLLHQDLLRRPKLVTRFVQERTILMMLRHEHIVGVRDLLSVDETLGLVMDLVGGGTLRQHLRAAGTLAPEEAARLLAQVAAALAEAHGLGVVHRDVKPDNILLDDRDGRLDTRLTDFGIARMLDTAGFTTPHAVVGTPHYMAPEVITGGTAGSAADVYALGAVLYELLTGRPPYTGEPIAVMRQHLDDTPRRHPGLPEAAWPIITSCLAKQPDQRPAATDLADALRDLVQVTAGVPALPHAPEESEPDEAAVVLPSVADKEAAPAGPLAAPAGPLPAPAGPLPAPAGPLPVPARSVPGSVPRSAPGAAPHRAGRDRRNRPRTWHWGALAAISVVLSSALVVGGLGAWDAHDVDAGNPLSPYAAPTAPSTTTAATGPSRSAAVGRPTATPERTTTTITTTATAAGDRSGGGTAGTGPLPEQDGVRAPAGQAEATPSPTAPAQAGAIPDAYGPWRCAPGYDWDIGHPVLAQPCHALGEAIRVIGHLQASPGVQADITLTLEDAATGAAAAGPHICRALMFTDFQSKHSCGPVDFHAPHGHRYTVVLSWAYTARDLLPGGTVTGPEFDW